MLEGWLRSRVVCCHCLVINDMRKVYFYTFCVWCCYRQAFNFWRWLWFLLLVMTNSGKQNTINPCLQGYLLAADNRQEIKTIHDSVLFLLATDGSFQIMLEQNINKYSRETSLLKKNDQAGSSLQPGSILMKQDRGKASTLHDRTKHHNVWGRQLFSFQFSFEYVKHLHDFKVKIM